jgi:prepilin-type N-terminal cleavage/methylation domain-containing protein
VVGWRRQFRENGAFTLLEVLVALAVSSVGISIFISLFSSSLMLAQTSRNQGVAANLAEEQLEQIAHNPAQYVWPLKDAGPGQLVELKPAAAGANETQALPLPGIMPPERDAATRQKSLFERFTWRAFAQAPEPGAAFVQFHVDRSFSVGSCLPLNAVSVSTAPGAAK